MSDFVVKSKPLIMYYPAHTAMKGAKNVVLLWRTRGMKDILMKCTNRVNCPNEVKNGF